MEESAEFLASARRIVGAIASYRGTVTWPSNTGPGADVLHSAAGDSAEHPRLAAAVAGAFGGRSRAGGVRHRLRVGLPPGRGGCRPPG